MPFRRRLIIAAFCLPVLLALIGAAQAADGGKPMPKGDLLGEMQKADQLVDEAQALLKKNQLEAALLKANQAVALVPIGTAARSMRGNILMDLGRYKEALDDWETLEMMASPDDQDSWFIYESRGICRYKTGDQSGALADAQEAKKRAPATLPEGQRKDLEDLLRLTAAAGQTPTPTPLGAGWKRMMNRNGHDVMSIWELHPDGRCVVHLQTIKADGTYTVAGPTNQAWDGDELTSFGQATFAGGRWKLVFTGPNAETSSGTYELSKDAQKLFLTQDGFDKHVTRERTSTIVDEPLASFGPAESIPPASATTLEPASRVSGTIGHKYFVWGNVISSLSDYAYLQKTLAEPGDKLSMWRMLMVDLQAKDQVVAAYDAFIKLLGSQRFPKGEYNDWNGRDQRRWDRELSPAATSLDKAATAQAAEVPEHDFYYTLGYQAYELSTALVEDANATGINGKNARADLKRGLSEFVWLRDHRPASGLVSDVSDAVEKIADYNSRLDDLGDEDVPRAYVEKVIALSQSIETADQAGNLAK